MNVANRSQTVLVRSSLNLPILDRPLQNNSITSSAWPIINNLTEILECLHESGYKQLDWGNEDGTVA